MIGQDTAAPARDGATLPSRPASAELVLSRLLTAQENAALVGALTPPRSVGAHVDLLREGDRADRLFFVTRGWACRYATTRTGARLLSALILPGDLANLDSLHIERPDRGVRTVTEVTVVTLPRERALALTDQHPGIARAFAWLGHADQAILARRMLCVARLCAKERLAHLLCELSVRLDAEHGNESRFALPLTQEQFADALGLTAVHVNRTVRDLRADGLIVTADRTMILPDVARLRRLAGFDLRYLHLAAG